MSEPTPAVIETFGRREGDVVVLGAAGKMGPSLARMAHRACQAAGSKRRVMAVSRFTNQQEAAKLAGWGIETVQCDLLDKSAIERLPAAADVLYLAGTKFGSTGQEARLWVMNSYLPALVCRKYRHSRIVAFSTGNVYGMAPAAAGGSKESDPPNPVGEYAMSCLGRERVFEYFSCNLGIPVTLIRLNYACDLRYGVLVDLAQRIQAGAPVDLTTSYFNTIWQGDANAMTLLSFAHVASPPCVLNVTGPEELSVREVSLELGRLLDRPVRFQGAESPTALLSNAARARERFGPPRVTAAELMRWVADWIQRGGPTLGKPTRFERRDGVF